MSHKLFLLFGNERLELNISVPLAFEYEEATKRLLGSIRLESEEVDDILDYILALAHQRKIFFLWRPYLPDADDNLVLEVAVESRSDYIITHNKKDFIGVEKFGIKAVSPKELRGEIE